MLPCYNKVLPSSEKIDWGWGDWGGGGVVGCHSSGEEQLQSGNCDHWNLVIFASLESCHSTLAWLSILLTADWSCWLNNLGNSHRSVSLTIRGLTSHQTQLTCHLTSLLTSLQHLMVASHLSQVSQVSQVLLVLIFNGLGFDINYIRKSLLMFYWCYKLYNHSTILPSPP